MLPKAEENLGNVVRWKVVFLIAGLDIGGAEKQLLAYVSRRPDLIDAVVIYFSAPKGANLIAAFQETGVRTILVDRSRLPLVRFLRMLVKQIRELKPDIVHAFLDGTPATWGRLAGLLSGVSRIFQSDRSLQPPITRLQSIMRPWLDRVTMRFLTNAHAIAAWLRSTGIQDDKIRVIPNGVDLGDFLPDAITCPRATWDIPMDATVLGFLGKFRPEKRLDLLLKALVALPEADRPDYVMLGGEGSTLTSIMDQIQGDSWLSDRCKLLGLINSAPEFLAGVDYLVLCSDYEGFPNVIVEAMAMGKPIVATAVSDVPAIIEGVGFTASPGDVGSLAGALKAMQKVTPAERRKMGENARERVMKNWDIERVAEAFWNNHLEVLP